MRHSASSSVIAILLMATLTYGQQNRVLTARVADNQPGTVTLPLTEYNHLLQLADAEAHRLKPADAPLPFVLSGAVFKLTLENDSVVGTLDISGEILRKGPTKVPLVADLTVLDAQQSGSPVPLVEEGSDRGAVISGPGPFSVSLRVAAPVSVDAGRASFTLIAPAASTALLTLDLPGNHANVRVEPGLITHRVSDAGRTIIEATLEPGKSAKAWWTTREQAAPVAQREVRFLSDMKTVVSVGDSELRMTALSDVTVVQGEPTEFRMTLPPGFDVIEVEGTTLESSEVQSGVLVLKVREASARAHQFLVGVERASKDNKLDVPFWGFSNAQRETGELLVEGVGTMELTATEGGGLKRIDVREAQPVARSLARFPLQAAFRYHNRIGDAPKLQLEWNEFPDGQVISAIAEEGTVTTLLNAEGKSLTEVTLRVRNHAQPFMKVELPQGATLLSAEVEGEGVKPVQGSDGSRVPLLRSGARPSGAYTVSFVYLSSGPALSKNGTYQMTLPKLDVPVSVLTWEVSLPDRVEVKQFGGTAFADTLIAPGTLDTLYADDANVIDESSLVNRATITPGIANVGPGQIGGIVVDPSGAVVAGADVKVVNKQTGATQETKANAEGQFVVAGVQSGAVEVTVESQGFKTYRRDLDLRSGEPSRLGVTLDVGSVSEAVEITSSSEDSGREYRRPGEQRRKTAPAQQAPANTPSANVFNLQRKVAGILPVRMEVPRAGRSYRFVRPLVLDEETNLSFQYKLK